MQFVTATHKASHLRTCYPVWFDEESLLLPEGCLRASTKEDRRGGVAIATSVFPGKPSFPVGFGVAAMCCISRLKQVSLGGLEASWSVNYTARGWYSNFSVRPIPSYRNISNYCGLVQSISLCFFLSFILCYNPGITQCLNLSFKVKATWHKARTHLCLVTRPRQGGIDSYFIVFLTAAWIRARDSELWSLPNSLKHRGFLKYALISVSNVVL